MLSVLLGYTSHEAAWPVRQPSVGLFADQEIRLLKRPLFAETEYLVKRRIVARTGSRRTESYWVRSDVFDAAGSAHPATVLLNSAVLKESYAGYPKEDM